MTCQTGIRADEKLLDFFEQCKQCKVRFGKIVINNERLCVNHNLKPSKDWRKDWKKCLPDCVDAYEPCFLLFRFDSSHDWILISFSDDKASTRDKMMLAATKATFKSEFGQSFVRAEYQISNRNELELDQFEKRHLRDSELLLEGAGDGDAAAEDARPLSFVERELSAVAKERANIPFSMHASQTLRGVQFPIDQDAEKRLKEFGDGELDFVQLSAIKLEAHSARVASPEALSAGGDAALIPPRKPRYSLFRLRNATGEDQNAVAEPTFFIYSVPPSDACTIKEKMLYSSCKGPLLGELQGPLGVRVDKKIEVDSREQLDFASLMAYVAPEPPMPPPSAQMAPQFERPARPGAGPRRITKSNANG
ncbi:hypothetical protein niasHS_014096 [Heterodera schachtii]|uniref:ADF-H domain-containing protein n=1 Tax=Heterodera schachtii TaxID=97005 RepID=A0ABD2II38_HETSC